MNVDMYLNRIKCDGLKELSLANLTTLTQRHFQHVPFENFDMHLGKRIEYDLQDSVERIVRQSRGGWCIQLNLEGAKEAAKEAEGVGAAGGRGGGASVGGSRRLTFSIMPEELVRNRGGSSAAKLAKGLRSLGR